jgi:hypothetical protein
VNKRTGNIGLLVVVALGVGLCVAEQVRETPDEAARRAAEEMAREAQRDFERTQLAAAVAVRKQADEGYLAIMGQPLDAFRADPAGCTSPHLAEVEKRFRSIRGIMASTIADSPAEVAWLFDHGLAAGDAARDRGCDDAARGLYTATAEGLLGPQYQGVRDQVAARLAALDGGRR